jgi:SAM-dependent methyltransferase
VTDQVAGLLAEQARYYRERAGEYEDWWFRRGRYDGGGANARWFAEVAEVEDALERFHPAGRVLALACGTGLWTRRLVGHAEAVTAVDASPEVIELARAGLDDPRVSYACRPVRVGAAGGVRRVFLRLLALARTGGAVRELLGESRAGATPRGKVFFVDSLPSDPSSAVDHRLPYPGEETMTRRLADGREFRIVKRFYEPHALSRRLADLGWDAQGQATTEFFIYGQATKISERVGWIARKPADAMAVVDLGPHTGGDSTRVGRRVLRPPCTNS